MHGGIVAPPTMLQAWILARPSRWRTPTPAAKNKQQELHKLLSEAGYTGVVATNSEQEYTRYLRPGDRVDGASPRSSRSPSEKATGARHRLLHRDAHRASPIRTDAAGRLDQRSACSSSSPRSRRSRRRPPAARPPKPRRLRAPRAHDNGWWWEGVDRGELLIQKCSECGDAAASAAPDVRRSASRPPGPASSRRGSGTVYSFVVLRHPPIPGYDFPLPVALIDLEEGTRIVSNVVGCKPEDVHIGMKVRLSIENVDEEMKLPLFRPAA